MSTQSLRIATRRSALALWQSRWVAETLEKFGATCSLDEIITTGDKLQQQGTVQQPAESSSTFAAWDTGKGVFVKEIQQALLAGTSDLAVHSFKDLPYQNPKELCVAAVMPRAAVADVLVLSPRAAERVAKKFGSEWSKREYADLEPILGITFQEMKLPVASSSARRRMYLEQHFGNQCQVVPIRGNVDTRVKKLKNHEFSAIVLAKAGLERLGLLESLPALTMPSHIWIPAPAQGIVAIECARNNEKTLNLLSQVNHVPTAVAACFERFTLELLRADCSSPIGAFYDKGTLRVFDGRHRKYAAVSLPSGLEDVVRNKFQDGMAFTDVMRSVQNSAHTSTLSELLRAHGITP